MTSRKKIVSLKKQVESNLKLKGIPNLQNLGLKRVNLTAKNRDKSIENTIFKKAGKGLLSSIEINKNNLEAIENLVGNGHLSIKLRTDLSEEELNTLKATYNNPDETYLIVELHDSLNNKTEHLLSFLNFRTSKKSDQGVYKLKREGYRFYQVLSLDFIVGLVYIFNEIEKYAQKNPDVFASIQKRQYEKMSLEVTEEDVEWIYDYWSKGSISFYGDELNIVEETTMGYKGVLPLAIFLPYSQETKDVFGNNIYYFVSYYRNVIYFSLIYDHIISLNNEEVYRTKTYRRQQSDYARSFQTKKNIPEYVKKAMEKSLFNKHFGFVEYDELIDLDLISHIEKEWLDINRKINFPERKNHSLRFRRLGHHNAGGLYYANQKAVCIDLSSPGSLIHEVFHMIDYTADDSAFNLSERNNFNKIIDIYRKALEEIVSQLPKSNNIKVNWNSKNKYNKEYYLSKEEIFARSGEIYVQEILKIKTNLISTNSYIYPIKNRELLEAIKLYFDNLFTKLK